MYLQSYLVSRMSALDNKNKELADDKQKVSNDW